MTKLTQSNLFRHLIGSKEVEIIEIVSTIRSSLTKFPEPRDEESEL